MALFDNIGLKLCLSLVIALLSFFYQLETEDEFLICEKLVLLSKNKSFVFDSLSNLEGYPAVSIFVYLFIILLVTFKVIKLFD